MNSPEKEAAALARRVLGEDLAAGFSFEQIESGRDVFELENVNATIRVRGNTAVSMAAGLNWYLRHYAGADVSWCGVQLKVQRPLPAVPGRVRKTSWAKHRYFLNYVCFSYSLAWWDWPQWEKLIDWMALNGVTMPLAVTGQEAVWEAVGRRLGFSPAQMEAFFSGPAFLPFVWMGCLNGWAGPLPAGWTEARRELGQKILRRERALGMTPVLQGFTGHVPGAVAEKFPEARLNKISYLEWQTHFLDPFDPLFARIAGLFLEEQERLYGTDHFYATDPFIEMVPPSGETKYLGDLSRAIYHGMAHTDPRAVWVLQGWPFDYHMTRDFWTQERIQAFFEAVPDDGLLVLDLFCESNPAWIKTGAFGGKPWLWCNVQNFGGNITLTGALERNTSGLMAARRESKNLIGLGMVNEGLCFNPPVYEFLFEQAWHDEPADVAAWLRGYSHRRYGKSHPDAEAAWDLLLQTAYADFRFFEERVGGHKSLLARRPDLKPPGAPFYDNRELAAAWSRLAKAADALGQTDTYRFDLVHLARHVLSNHAAKLRTRLAKAAETADREAFQEAAEQFLQLLRDLEELVATREEFLLEPWISDARRWGATDAEKDLCEWNARLLITHFGAKEDLHDYARKEWAGMLEGYYLPRWKSFFEARLAAWRKGEDFDENGFTLRRLAWERDWLRKKGAEPAAIRGDSIEVARRLWLKYENQF